MNELVNNIKLQTEIMFVNVDIMLKTCDLNFTLCDMPIWKHVYHMLHSCDQWFINPFDYVEPDFHEPNLNSLDIPSKSMLLREMLSEYHDKVRVKILSFLNSLTDENLYEIPQGCKSNRLGLMFSQYRHFYAHLGNINGDRKSVV